MMYYDDDINHTTADLRVTNRLISGGPFSSPLRELSSSPLEGTRLRPQPLRHDGSFSENGAHTRRNIASPTDYDASGPKLNF